jgi:hypothetical protein
MVSKKLLSALFLTISSCILFAQDSGFLPGFIITNSSDTIKGLVKYINQVPYRVLSDIKFKENEEAKTQQYSANELIGYKAEEKIFNSVSTSGKEGARKFMELIADGYVKTYRLTVSSFRTSTYGANTRTYDYLLKTGDTKPYKIDAYNWNETLSDYLSDNKTLANRIRNGVYTYRDLPDIVKEYNASH